MSTIPESKPATQTISRPVSEPEIFSVNTSISPVVEVLWEERSFLGCMDEAALRVYVLGSFFAKFGLEFNS